jgi:hypothetical protein
MSDRALMLVAELHGLAGRPTRPTRVSSGEGAPVLIPALREAVQEHDQRSDAATCVVKTHAIELDCFVRRRISLGVERLCVHGETSLVDRC